MDMEKSKQYTLSVIIPSYNKCNYIQKCIQSVLEQSLLPNEIIVVDDRSTDNSREIIKSFCQKYDYIKAVYLEKNGGVSHARNVGLQSAKSEFVTFLDADDFYGNKYKLQNEMALISKYGCHIIAYSKLNFADVEGNIIRSIRRTSKDYLVGNIYLKLLTGRFEFVTIARDYCVEKKDLLEVGGYNENRDLYEDLELLIKLAENHKFFCTYEYGTAYRQVPGGLSKRKKTELKRVRNEIFYENIQHFSLSKRIWLSIIWEWEKIKRRILDGIWVILDLLKMCKGYCMKRYNR